jgi:hypothetical protein
MANNNYIYLSDGYLVIEAIPAGVGGNTTQRSIQLISPNLATGGLLQVDSQGNLLLSTGGMGITGPVGPQGPAGATGPQGIMGVMGPQGIAGVAGVAGVGMTSGPTGANLLLQIAGVASQTINWSGWAKVLQS